MRKILSLIIISLVTTGCGCGASEIDYQKVLLEEHYTEYTDENFFTAVVINDFEVVELFLKAGTDPDTLTATKNRMMHSAISFDAIETINLLAEYGADMNFVNDYGVNYLYFASINRQKCETINSLVEAGVDLNYETENGSNAKDAATGQLQYQPLYQEQIDCLEALGL